MRRDGVERERRPDPHVPEFALAAGAAVAAALAAVACLDGVRAEGLAGLPVGLALAAGLALPAAGYLVRYGDPPGSPRGRAAASLALAGAVVAVGAALSRPVLGGATALALGLTGARHAAVHAPPTPRTRRRAVGGTVALGAVVAAAGAVVGVETPVVVGLTLALGGALGGALARPSSRKR